MHVLNVYFIYTFKYTRTLYKKTITGDMVRDYTLLHTCCYYLQFFNHTADLPFLWDSLRHCATFPGCVDDLNIIWGKLNQISQGT